MKTGSFPTGSFWVISAERPEHTTVINRRRTSELRLLAGARGYAIRSVEGYWDGQREAATVLASVGGSFEFVADMLTRFAQDAALYVDRHGAAFLYGRDGSCTPVGTWRAVDRASAEASQGYTFDPETGAYYVAS